MKTWIDENNKKFTDINDSDRGFPYEQIIDNKIINKSEIDYNNLPNWPKRSPFEFYNKNVIIPDNYKLSKNYNNNERLNPIKDNLNPFISKNETETNEIKKINDVKISLIKPNLQENENNYIIIQQNPSNDNEENNNLDKNENDENNDVKNDFSFVEQDIIYNFGYKKEERLEPIHLSLIKDTIADDEEKITKFQNQIQKEKLEQSLKEKNLFSNRNKNRNKTKNENNNINNIYDYRNKDDLNIKNIILSKTEKDIEYFKEKDLFDEEINDENFNVTQKQMNAMDEETNKYYNYYKEASKKKNFNIIHPYLEYEKYIQKEKINNLQNSIDNHLTISEKNLLRQNRLKPILDKQKSIINNIMFRKYNLNNNNSMNDIKMKYKLEKNNSSSVITNNSLDKKYKYNPTQKNLLKYQSYTIKDYRDKYFNEKIKDFGGLGANLGGEEWKKRQRLLERKKDYSKYVLFNEKINMQEKRNLRYNKSKLIKKIKIKENNENNDIIAKNDDNNLNNFKFPLIKPKLNKEGKKDSDNINKDENKNKVYISAFFPLKKYKVKKETDEDKFNKILENNSQLGILYQNHNMFNSKFENIKSHIK